MKVGKFFWKLAKFLGLFFIGLVPESNVLESQEEKEEKKAKDEGKKGKDLPSPDQDTPLK
jgi:hypothetical protein